MNILDNAKSLLFVSTSLLSDVLCNFVSRRALDCGLGSFEITIHNKDLDHELGLYGLQRTSATKNMETKKKAFNGI